MSFIKKYKDWRFINEAKSVSKGERSGGEKEKVIIKTLDSNSFEYKIINAKLMPGTEVVNSAGLISSPSMVDVLINNVNNETEITNVIGKLDSEFFKNNILVYEVKKDKEGLFGRDVQVIVFTKTARPQGIDASVKAIAAGQAVTSNVPKSVIAGLETVASGASNPVTTNTTNTGSNTKTELPASLAKLFPMSIKGATGKTIRPAAKTFLNALVDIFKNSEKVSATALYKDFATEVAGLDNTTGVLGDATETMVKAMKAGYGLKDIDNADLTAPLVQSVIVPDAPSNPSSGENKVEATTSTETKNTKVETKEEPKVETKAENTGSGEDMPTDEDILKKYPDADPNNLYEIENKNGVKFYVIKGDSGKWYKSQDQTMAETKYRDGEGAKATTIEKAETPAGTSSTPGAENKESAKTDIDGKSDAEILAIMKEQEEGEPRVGDIIKVSFGSKKDGTVDAWAAIGADGKVYHSTDKGDLKDKIKDIRKSNKTSESVYIGIDGRIHTRIFEGANDLLNSMAADEVAASDAGGGIKGFDYQAYRTVADKYTGIGSGFGDVDLSQVAFPLDPAKISGGQVNDDVKKVQQALINKFDATAMKGVYEYKAFRKYGADGRFGNGTKNLIKFIKANSDKFVSDKTAVITKEFMMEVSKAKVE